MIPQPDGPIAALVGHTSFALSAPSPPTGETEGVVLWGLGASSTWRMVPEQICPLSKTLKNAALEKNLKYGEEVFFFV